MWVRVKINIINNWFILSECVLSYGHVQEVAKHERSV